MGVISRQDNLVDTAQLRRNKAHCKTSHLEDDINQEQPGRSYWDSSSILRN